MWLSVGQDMETTAAGNGPDPFLAPGAFGGLQSVSRRLLCASQ